MTGEVSPLAIARLKIVLRPELDRTILEISLGLMVMLMGSLKAPYSTAGMLPSFRVRRASFFPREARTSAVTVISFLKTLLLQRDRSPIHFPPKNRRLRGFERP